jgi:hypothetical protein
LRLTDIALLRAVDGRRASHTFGHVRPIIRLETVTADMARPDAKP